jgi:hypothetical protein
MNLDGYIAERDVIVIGASVASQCLAEGWSTTATQSSWKPSRSPWSA